MKKLLTALSLLLFTSLAFAFPILKITAPVNSLATGQTAALTFSFYDSTTLAPLSVSGFDLTDAHIKGDATWASALSGSGATYTATIQKLVTRDTVSVVVDNKSYTATTGGATGAGATIGFNPTPVIYVRSGNSTSQFIAAVPQPTCPLPGAYLADASGNPVATPVEDFYTLEYYGRQGLLARKLPFSCLVRLTGVLNFRAKVSPPNRELINYQGAHNHSTEMPKATTQLMSPLVGTTRIRIAPSNVEGCTLNGSLVLQCQTNSRVYDGGASAETPDPGGESRFSSVASKFLDDDPIVCPGIRGCAHLHVFYGNNSITYQTNNANILTGCVSMFTGGAMNCTGYWTPAMINTANNVAMVPSGINIYYKSNGSRLTEVPTPGLRIIAGNPAAKQESEQTDLVKFQCFRRDGTSTSTFGYIPACSGTIYDELHVVVDFPTCVADDGAGNQVKDSVNHRSHLTRAGTGTSIGANNCPASHPHLISSITQNLDYPIKPGDNTATWRLSSDNYSSALPGGYSIHADWMNGWNQPLITRLVRDCNNKHFNCGQNYIGLSDGIGIINVVTTGNKAVLTTQVPHNLEISDPTTGAYPNVMQPNTEAMLLAQITGFTGTNAAMYNMDQNKISKTYGGVRVFAPAGVQRIKVLTATTIEYTLSGTPGTPINGAVDPAVVKIRWGESTCAVDSGCNTTYSDALYNK